MAAGRDPETNPAEAVAIAVSYEDDAALAVDDIAAPTGDPDPSFVPMFIPHGMDRAALQTALARKLPATAVFGCSTAGRIAPARLRRQRDGGAGLPARAGPRRLASPLVRPISPVHIAEVVTQAERLVARHPATPGRRVQFSRLRGSSSALDSAPRRPAPPRPVSSFSAKACSPVSGPTTLCLGAGARRLRSANQGRNCRVCSPAYTPPHYPAKGVKADCPQRA